MTRWAIMTIALVGVVCAVGQADTFRHRQTGQVFHGFVTQRQRQGQTLVFVAEENGFKPMALAEYEVTPDKQGRRQNVYVFPINQPEILLSKVVSETLSESIVEASNQGPLLIVLEIDNPGGQGPYMKTVANAVTQTTNCPVVAYIRGDRHGGAYSAAAVLGLACERMFIAPSAVIGSVAPRVDRAAMTADPAEHLALYSPENLAAFGMYVVSLAERKGREPVVARALVDRTTDVVEVQDLDGRRSVIDVKDRSSTQKVLRHLTQGAEPVAAGPAGQASTIPSDRYILTLTATQAVELRLADKIADALTDVLREMDVAEGKIVYSRGLDKTIQQYATTKRNISQGLTTIAHLQQRVDELQRQVNEVEEQIRKGTVTTEYRRGGQYYRSGPDRYSYNDPSRYWEGTYRSGRRDRRNLGQSEIRTFEVPAMSPEAMYAELHVVLNDLIREYRQVLNQAGRFPGALPPDTTVSMLQQRLDAAVALQNDLRRRASLMAPVRPVAPLPR